MIIPPAFFVVLQKIKLIMQLYIKSSTKSHVYSPLPLLQWTFVWVILNISTIRFDGTIATSLHIFFTIPPSKTPFLRSEDLLPSRELEFGTSQSFNCSGFMIILTTNGHQWLTNVDSSNGSLRFTISASHTSLEPISSSTRQHFVDANNMEWMDPH